MAKGLIKIQEELHHRLLRLRSIEAMIRRPQFDRLWDASSEAEQKIFQKLIADADRSAIMLWIKDHPSLELAEKPLSLLKGIASRLGITNVTRKSKLELIRDIQQRETDGAQQSINAQ